MEELEIYDEPTKWKGPWKFITLYKNNGDEREWNIIYENGELYTDEENIESKNGKDAFNIATKLYIEKINEGYLPPGCIELSPGKIKPMKANSFKDGNKDQDDYLVNKINKNWPVAVEPKLGGIRFFVCKTHDRIEGYGVNRNLIHHLTHIIDDIGPLLDYLPPFTNIDGELYIHGVDINVIKSMIKSATHPQINNLQYHIYDIILQNVPYEDRKDILVSAYHRFVNNGNKAKNFSIVPSYIAYDLDDILDIHESFVEMGMEGSMIKKMGNDHKDKKIREQSFYKLNSRCDNILKLKDVEDDEYEIVDLVSKDNNVLFTLKTINDVQFNCLCSDNTDIELKREYLDNKRHLKGKMATVVYKKLSEKGVPLFGKVRCIRDYE